MTLLSILPKGEGFSDRQFGAVALCVRDFTLFSRYRSTSTIIGGTSPDGFPGLDYICAPRARWYENRTRAYAGACIRIISQKQAALVEIHNRPHLLRLIAPHTAAKLALHLHNDPQEMEATRTPRERRSMAERCSAVYCVSEYIRSRFMEGLEDEKGQKVHVVYNGLALPPPPPPKENLIVYAGRMTQGKGALLLMQALRIALPELPAWRAVLIGSRRHLAAQSLAPHEKTIAEAMRPIAGQVDMPGFLSHAETLGWFARAAIAVVPSQWQEPFGRVALEAMAQGCALVSSGRGALREVTADAAVTPQELSAQSLADAILLLARDAPLRARMQDAGRARAHVFSMAKCAGMLDNIRDRILT